MEHAPFISTCGNPSPRNWQLRSFLCTKKAVPGFPRVLRRRPLQIKFRAKTKKTTSKSQFFLPVRRPKTSFFCVSGRFGVYKTAKNKRSTILPKGILNVSKNGRKCPLSDIWTSIYRLNALFTAFSFMLLSLKPSWFVCQLLAILKLCRILSVPWNRYVFRQDWKRYRWLRNFLVEIIQNRFWSVRLRVS